MMKGVAVCTKSRNPKRMPTIPWVNAPKMNNTLEPTLPPYRPNNGANMKAVKLSIPNTKPY